MTTLVHCTFIERKKVKVEVAQSFPTLFDPIGNVLHVDDIHVALLLFFFVLFTKVSFVFNKMHPI